MQILCRIIFDTFLIINLMCYIISFIIIIIFALVFLIGLYRGDSEFNSRGGLSENEMNGLRKSRWVEIMPNEE